MCLCVGSVFERDKMKEIYTMAAHCVNFKWHRACEWVKKQSERETKNECKIMAYNSDGETNMES